VSGAVLNGYVLGNPVDFNGKVEGRHGNELTEIAREEVIFRLTEEVAVVEVKGNRYYLAVKVVGIGEFVAPVGMGVICDNIVDVSDSRCW